MMKATLYGKEFDVRFWREHIVLSRSQKGTLYFRRLNNTEKELIKSGRHLKGQSYRTYCSISSVDPTKVGRERYTPVVEVYTNRHTPDKDNKVMGYGIAYEKALMELAGKWMVPFVESFEIEYKTMP
jgi:hypothetical protein